MIFRGEMNVKTSKLSVFLGLVILKGSKVQDLEAVMIVFCYTKALLTSRSFSITAALSVEDKFHVYTNVLVLILNWFL